MHNTKFSPCRAEKNLPEIHLLFRPSFLIPTASYHTFAAMEAPICRTITGATVAKPFKDAIAKETLTRRPKLLGVLASSNAPSRYYAEWTQK